MVYKRLSDMRSTIPPPVAWSLLILGVLSVVAAVFAYRAQRRFLRTAHRATGVVERVDEERWGRRTVYLPVIRFTTADGVTVSARPKSSQGGGYRVGQTISIAFNPAHPSSYEIDSWLSRWFLVVVASFFALVLLAIGTTSLLIQASARPEPTGYSLRSEG